MKGFRAAFRRWIGLDPPLPPPPPRQPSTPVLEGRVGEVVIVRGQRLRVSSFGSYTGRLDQARVTVQLVEDTRPVD